MKKGVSKPISTRCACLVVCFVLEIVLEIMCTCSKNMIMMDPIHHFLLQQFFYKTNEKKLEFLILKISIIFLFSWIFLYQNIEKNYPEKNVAQTTSSYIV